MIALITVDVIEIAVLPRTGINVKPKMYRIALVNIELLQSVCTEHTEEACTRILILRLDNKLLRLPCIACALGDALLCRIFLDDHSLYFYSL